MGEEYKYLQYVKQNLRDSLQSMLFTRSIILKQGVYLQIVIPLSYKLFNRKRGVERNLYEGESVMQTWALNEILKKLGPMRKKG